MHGRDFIGLMSRGFKFQITICDLDFERGMWAETYHNWAKIDDAGCPWIHGPRQSSNMLIGSIQREEFITGLILGWFLIFLWGGSDLNPNVQYYYYTFHVFCNKIWYLRNRVRFSCMRAIVFKNFKFVLLLQTVSTSSFRVDSCGFAGNKNLTWYLRYRIMSWKCCKRCEICSNEHFTSDKSKPLFECDQIKII